MRLYWKELIGVCAAMGTGMAFGQGMATVDGTVLTLDGLVTNVTTEADLGAVNAVVMRQGGGVAFAQSLTVDKTYSIAGDGLAATGVVSVAANRLVSVPAAARLANGTLGHVLVKRGAGKLTLTTGPGAVSTPTRWIVEEGVFAQVGASFFGNHKGTTTNLTLDVREGAAWRIDDGEHCPIGPLELTGGRLEMPGKTRTDAWGNTAFRGGVVAHACATPSTIDIGGNAHLNHVFTDVPFTVEPGAVLNVYGCLANGWTETAGGRVANRLIVSGGGELRLFANNTYTGGTVLRDGTTLLVGDPAALGTGGLEIDGTVTLVVPAGMTLTCPPVTGTGTLTKTGAGVALFPNVASGVTVVEGSSTGLVGEPLVDGVLYVRGTTLTINVPAGETTTVTEIVEAVPGCGTHCELVKTGAGTLVLPNTDNTGFICALTVQGGLVAGPRTEAWGQAVTLQGGGLDVTANMTLARPVTVTGTGWINVREGVSFNVTSNYFLSANAVVTKTGAGTLLAAGEFRTAATIGNARWVVDAGTLTLNNSTFAGHASLPSITLEIHEGATLRSNAHNPLGNIVLRGGTVTSSNISLNYGAGDGGATWGLERMARWYPYSFNGTITVLPSTNGAPSRISVPHAVCVSHASRTAAFDVQAGATLEVDALIQPGETAAASGVKTVDLVKRGEGDLVLLKNCGVQGMVSVEAGTVTLGADARFSPSARLSVAPGARIVLSDGSLLATQVDAAAGLLASADVWLDASRLVGESGATVTSVPNYGTSRGAFTPFTWTSSGKVVPGAPTFVKNGINGLGALDFNGAQALALLSHTNRTQNIEVFFVGAWTYWKSNVGGSGYWGGPLSFGSFAMTADDNHSKPSFSFQYTGGSLGASVSMFNQDRSIVGSHGSMAVGTPFFKHGSLLGGRMELDFFVDDTSAATTNTGSVTAGNLDVTIVSVGGRLTTGGVSQTISTATTDVAGVGKLAIAGGNRMFIGRVGEMLAFARSLSDGERAAVAAYLKRKWLNSSVQAAPVDVAEATPSALTVEVPAHARAVVAGTVAAPAASGGTVLAKTGAGRLDVAAQVDSDGAFDVAAGTVAFGCPVPSRADIWLDATDGSTITTNASGKVASVANKGRSGGTFHQAAKWSSGGSGVVPYPSYVAAGINGRPAVAFDGNSALVLNSYTNRASARHLHVYAALRRTSFAGEGGKGNWSGPFSFNAVAAARSSDGSGNDNHVPGSYHLEDIGATRVSHYLGDTLLQVDRPFDVTGTDHLFVAHQTPGLTVFAFERASDAANAVKQWGHDATKPMDIDSVVLGGRSATGGKVQWTSQNNGGNRMWFGYIGELIVFTQPLGYTEECELLAYLRKKWLNKGDGSATPPAFLSGAYATSLASADLRVADGAAVVQAGPTLALASLEAGANVSFARAGVGDAAGFALFDAAGEISVGANPSLAIGTAPTQTAKLIGGTPVGVQPTWTVTGDKAGQCRVAAKADGLYLAVANGVVIYLR